MKNSAKNASPKDAKAIKEDKAFSINDDSNTTAYPHKSEKDKQYKNQPEFIDRNSESKDKS